MIFKGTWPQQLEVDLSGLDQTGPQAHAARVPQSLGHLWDNSGRIHWPACLLELANGKLILTTCWDPNM